MVVDTNHHEIKRLDVETGNFGRLLDSYISGDSEAGNIWPCDLEPSVQFWWVTFCSDLMSNGKIVRYDQDWKRVGAVDLPAGASPVGMAWFDGAMWVSDINHFEIYRFDEQGEALQGYQHPQLDQYFQATMANQQKYALLSNVALGLMVLALVPGFAAAWVYDKANKRVAKQKEKAAASKAADWQRSSVKHPFFKRPWLGVANCALLTLFYLLMMWMIPFEWILHLAFIGLIALSYLASELIKLIAETEVRLVGDLLQVRQAGSVSGARLGDIRHTKGLLIVGTSFIVFGQPKMRHYPGVDELIKQGLRPENRMNYLQSRMQLMKIGSPIPYIEAITLVLTIFVLLIELIGVS